jgi:hypothetical protein
MFTEVVQDKFNTTDVVLIKWGTGPTAKEFELRKSTCHAYGAKSTPSQDLMPRKSERRFRLRKDCG